MKRGVAFLSIPALALLAATAIHAATAAPLPYVFPVQPPEVASYGRYHHDYPAADIFAPQNSHFVAVTSGVIDEVSYEDHWVYHTDDPALRGGRFVSLIGDDGVRYYGSHLASVVPGLAPGTRVQAGQLLGYVGNSGNARGGRSHLHFGISHPTFAGDWKVRRGEIQPYPYLQAWQHGRIVSVEVSGAATPAPPHATD
jgi:murein DD-endopeptidase MepM/ murein hydrolase activator NlpD